MFQYIFAFIGVFAGFWVFIKYVLLVETRIDASLFKTVYDLHRIKKERIVILTEEFADETTYPQLLCGFCLYKSVPWFYINHIERLMNAGWASKDHVTIITCLRWQQKKIKEFLKKSKDDLELTTLGIPVEVIGPYGTDKIGKIKSQPQEPVVPKECWQDIDREAKEVFVDKTRQKSSALLYGPPGNGKTSLIRYLSSFYRVPIKIITFAPDYTNHDLMIIFSQIPPRSLVLFEDFDNYFDGRRCILGGDNKGIKFTFDIILNGLDGVYNTYEQVMFIMTVNDFGKVDSALTNRPSRFKYVKKFDNPSLEVREKLIGDWAENTEGYNLDQIFRIKEFKELGLDLNSSLDKIKENNNLLAELAYKRYQERLGNSIPGNESDDWQYAQTLLGKKL